MRLEVSARTSASRSDDPSCTCSFLPAEVLWTAPVQGVHSSWTGGRPLCVSPLSFGNPALISLFPQREACWLPVACGLTKIGPDMMASPSFLCPPDENQADCFLWGGSGSEKPKAAGEPQMGENKKKKNPPDFLTDSVCRARFQRPQGCLWARVLQCCNPRSFLPDSALLKRGCACGPPCKTSAAGRLAPCNSSELKPS